MCDFCDFPCDGLVVCQILRNFADMNITLIGLGNLGSHLERRLREAGHDLHCWSRQMGGEIPSAPIYIICVSDSAIHDVAERLPKESIVIHTSGCTPMDVLPQRCRGVLYPLYTFSRQAVIEWERIPLFLEATPEAREVVQKIGESLLPLQTTWLDSTHRRRLHLAGVWGCNMVNHCCALAQRQMELAGQSFELLLPIIDATAAKLHQMPPTMGQTGPAVRGDVETMRAHEALLSPEEQTIYHLLSESIARYGKS